MDVTTLFKACVKTVITTNKNFGGNVPKSNILKNSNKDVHLKKAKEIIRQITTLQTFLLDNKAAYLNVINYLSTNKTMTEIDREKVDLMAENIISTCTNLISDYKTEIHDIADSEQRLEHYHNVIGSLERYLKAVSKIYAEAKAVRVKRVIDTHKLSKLETKPHKTGIDTNKVTSNMIGSGDSAAIKNETNISQPPLLNFDNELSTEDMQMFEEENEHLFNELNNISGEVQQMESKVVHIAELQQLFTEKVLQQEKDIERIAETVVGSTENIKDANKQIKQAIQRNAGLRVWILFFLLVMSFSLLFLDWYND
ncbi:syntaxin 18 [Rhynchophorus ferrugineus]|uniref:syntaxin 18 n=1 Tax=Rhynchophorus ferrugineus TaxID=354439 RepID=UPI003FCD7FC7